MDLPPKRAIVPSICIFLSLAGCEGLWARPCPGLLSLLPHLVLPPGQDTGQSHTQVRVWNQDKPVRPCTASVFPDGFARWGAAVDTEEQGSSAHHLLTWNRHHGDGQFGAFIFFPSEPLNLGSGCALRLVPDQGDFKSDHSPLNGRVSQKGCGDRGLPKFSGLPQLGGRRAVGSRASQYVDS